MKDKKTAFQMSGEQMQSRRMYDFVEAWRARGLTDDQIGPNQGRREY